MSKVLTVFEIEAEIKKQKQAIAELETQLEVAKLESPEQQLAKTLHNMFCTWNHTDGCGLFYEFKNKQDDWSGHAHSEYLGRAMRLTHTCQKEGVEIGKALELFKMVRGY